MTKCLLIPALFAMTLIGAPVYDTSALGELTGARQSTDGEVVIASGSNYTTFQISWSIAPVAGGYQYQYTFSFTPTSPAGSHFILDLSDNCTATSGCIVNPNYPSLEYGTFGPLGGN